MAEGRKSWATKRRTSNAANTTSVILVAEIHQKKKPTKTAKEVVPSQETGEMLISWGPTDFFVTFIPFVSKRKAGFLKIRFICLLLLINSMFSLCIFCFFKNIFLTKDVFNKVFGFLFFNSAPLLIKINKVIHEWMITQ